MLPDKGGIVKTFFLKDHDLKPRNLPRLSEILREESGNFKLKKRWEPWNMNYLNLQLIHRSFNFESE